MTLTTTPGNPGEVPMNTYTKLLCLSTLSLLGACAPAAKTPDAVFGLVKLSEGNYHPVAQFKTMAECEQKAQEAYKSPEGSTADAAKIVVACGAVYDQRR
jgi:hypothetical protein